MRNRHEIGRKTGQMSKEKQKRGLRTSTIAHALWQSAHAQTLDAHHDTRCTSDESMHTHFLKRRRRVLCCIFLLGRATNECTCSCVFDGVLHLKSQTLQYQQHMHSWQTSRAFQQTGYKARTVHVLAKLSHAGTHTDSNTHSQEYPAKT